MSDSQDSRIEAAILRTEHLTRLVGTAALVNDVSVSVVRGEIMAVCGPSGAGKSSFLRLINRLDEPTSGTCFLAGMDYRQLAPRELRRRIGLVLQTPFLFPGTVADNLRFGPSQRGETVPIPSSHICSCKLVCPALLRDRSLSFRAAKPSAFPSLARLPILPRSFSSTSLHPRLMTPPNAPWKP